MTLPQSQITLLTDARLGIITNLHPIKLPPELPQTLHYWEARLSKTPQLGTRATSVATGGSSWQGASLAQLSATGEAVEHYCAAFVPGATTLLRTSYEALTDAGQAALSPADYTLYSPQQYATPRFPFRRFEPDLRVNWVSGRDMLGGQRVYVPASLVYPGYFSGQTQSEPLTNFSIMPGLAAGTDLAMAERAALEELIERDSVTLAWLRGKNLLQVKMPSGYKATLPSVMDIRVVAFPNSFNLPVIGVLLINRETQLLTLGTACRPTALEAYWKALAEACSLQLFAGRLRDDPAYYPYLSGDNLLKKWRADRQYRQVYRPDWQDMRDLACHMQYYLDPTTQPLFLERFLEGPAVELGDLPSAGERSREAYLNLLTEAGFRPLTINLTLPDVATVGWHAVRVLIPGLYPNAPAAFPFLGGQRLYEGGLSQADLNRLPLPFA